MENEEKVNDTENKASENDTVNTENSSEIKPDGPDYKAMYEEANDKFLRLYSEFDNFKKRSAREKVDLINSAGADVLKSILPVLDDFERAIKANQTTSDIDAIKSGFQLISQKLFHSLESKGLKKMDVIGQSLDVELHEAITNIPAPTNDLKGKVVDVVENGYFINDKVLRYAKVVVGE